MQNVKFAVVWEAFDYLFDFNRNYASVLYHFKVTDRQTDEHMATANIALA